jgi:ankyrin repeat protein
MTVRVRQADAGVEWKSTYDRLVELIEAVKSADASTARSLAVADPELMKTRDEEGLLPATHALYRGQADLARDLLPPDPDLTVFEAATFGREDRVSELLDENPALIREWSPDGFTVLHLAVFSGSEPTVRVVLDRSPDIEAASQSSVAKLVRPIHTAVFVRRVGLARLLLDAGADVNARESGGATTLHVVSQKGDIEMARLLLERGADPRLRDDQGRLPVDVARATGAQALVELLGVPAKR